MASNSWDLPLRGEREEADRIHVRVKVSGKTTVPPTTQRGLTALTSRIYPLVLQSRMQLQPGVIVFLASQFITLDYKAVQLRMER